MASTTTNTQRVYGGGSGETADPRSRTAARAPFGATLTVTLSLAFAGFLLIMSLVWVLHPPSRLPGVYASAGDQNQTTKTALYLLTFGVILPFAVLAAPRLADAIARRPNGPALPALAALMAGTLAATVLVVKASGLLPWGDGTGVVFALVGLWAVTWAALLARAAALHRPSPPLVRLAERSDVLYAATGALVFGAVLCVATLRSLNPVVLLVGLAAVAAVLLIRDRRPLPQPSRPLGAGIDVALALLLLLAIPDVVIFTTGPHLPSWLTATGIIQFHQNFLLGPTNQLSGGGALLVDDPVSQYGVGSIYFLSAWFHLSHIGYGTYGLLDDILTALVYLAGYCVLRIGGVSRLLASVAIAVGVVALVYNYAYSVGGIPQQGPMRFGLPIAAILALAAGGRWAAHARLARGVALVVLGIASVWALEGFVYTLLVFAAMTCFEASQRRAGTRLRWLARQTALAAAAIVCAHAIFAAATLIAAGALPDWGQYLAYVRTFLLGGNAGSITYGFARWSPGLAVGAAYFASAAALVLLVRRRHPVVERERTALLALSGTTAYGVALYSYFDNRSATFLLLYVALPVLLTVTLWLAVIGRSADIARPARSAVLAAGLAVAVLLLAGGWSSATDRFPRTALAHAFPGKPGLRGALVRLWHPPPMDPRSTEGVRLLRTYMPGERRSIVLVTPDLGIEILVRSGRQDRLSFGDPIEESFIAKDYLPFVERAVTGLRPGERMLLDQSMLRSLATLRANPGMDPLRVDAPASGPTSLVSPLQQWALHRIDQRFRLRTVYRNPSGFTVVQLDPRA